MGLSRDDLNPKLLHAEYAVRGPIVQRAQELEEQGREIIYCNIGNPQALQQRPLSYLRQVLSLLEYPELLQRSEVRSWFPRDLLERAREILRLHPHGTGAYTQSIGLPFVRQAVADFIRKRDGIPAEKNHIILTDGASKGAQSVLLGLLRGPEDGVMIRFRNTPCTVHRLHCMEDARSVTIWMRMIVGASGKKPLSRAFAMRGNGDSSGRTRCHQSGKPDGRRPDGKTHQDGHRVCQAERTCSHRR